MQRLEQRRDPLGVREREPAVEVHRHVALVAEHRPGRGDALHDAVDVGDAGDGAHPPARVHLDCGEADRELSRNGVGDLEQLVEPCYCDMSGYEYICYDRVLGRRLK